MPAAVADLADIIQHLLNHMPEKERRALEEGFIANVHGGQGAKNGAVQQKSWRDFQRGMKSWDKAKHPRGQPGNAGQFGSGGGKKPSGMKFSGTRQLIPESLLELAQQAGVDPKEADQQGLALRSQHGEYLAHYNDILARMRTFAKNIGSNLHHLATGMKEGDPGKIAKWDEVVEQFGPEMFPGEPLDAVEGKLFDAIHKGNLKPFSPEEAFKHSVEQIRVTREIDDAKREATEAGHSAAEIEEALRVGEEEGFAEGSARGDAYEDGSGDASFDFGETAERPATKLDAPFARGPSGGKDKFAEGGTWLRTESSNMLGAQYDPDAKRMVVQFQNGGIYTVFPISPAEAHAFAHAPSHGVWFTQNAKLGKKDVQKLPSSDDKLREPVGEAPKPSLADATPQELADLAWDEGIVLSGPELDMLAAGDVRAGEKVRAMLGARQTKGLRTKKWPADGSDIPPSTIPAPSPKPAPAATKPTAPASPSPSTEEPPEAASEQSPPAPMTPAPEKPPAPIDAMHDAAREFKNAPSHEAVEPLAQQLLAMPEADQKQFGKEIGVPGGPRELVEHFLGHLTPEQTDTLKQRYTEGSKAEPQAAAEEPTQDATVYAPDLTKPNPKTGLVEHARVGVPAMSIPDKIPRMPNLDHEQRTVETQVSGNYPDHLADKYLKALDKRTVGEYPNLFGTDDVKMLMPQWNPGRHEVGDELSDESKDAMAKYNVAVHQTANAVAKQAFLKYLDQLPEGQRTVLVTNGGVASGKGSSLKRSTDTESPYHGLVPAADQVGAIWDAAGEQNATENEWVLQECKKRGVKPTFAYVWAEPSDIWDSPTRGVIRRAMRKGRMVPARLFADSYAHGARNMKAFVDKHPDADFIFLDNRKKGDPKLLDKFPEETLRWDADAIYQDALAALAEREGDLPPALYEAGKTAIWDAQPEPQKERTKYRLAGLRGLRVKKRPEDEDKLPETMATTPAKPAADAPAAKLAAKPAVKPPARPAVEKPVAEPPEAKPDTLVTPAAAEDETDEPSASAQTRLTPKLPAAKPAAAPAKPLKPAGPSLDEMHGALAEFKKKPTPEAVGRLAGKLLKMSDADREEFQRAIGVDGNLRDVVQHLLDHLPAAQLAAMENSYVEHHGQQVEVGSEPVPLDEKLSPDGPTNPTADKPGLRRPALSPEKPAPTPPVKSEAVLERTQHLLTPVVRQKKLGGGINDTHVVTLEGGVKGVWKPARGETANLRDHVPTGTFYRRETATSQVADILGMSDLVPATATRKVGEEDGSVQEFIPGASTAANIKNPYDGWEDLERAAALDYAVGQTDRHPGNWMLTHAPGFSDAFKRWIGGFRTRGVKLKLIDNGLTFPTAEHPRDFTNHDLLRAALERKVPDLSAWEGKWKQIESSLRDTGIENAAILRTKNRFAALLEASKAGSTFGDLAYGSTTVRKGMENNHRGMRVVIISRGVKKASGML